MSIQAVILNLPKDVERRRTCQEELERWGLSYSFFSAISGDQLEEMGLLGAYDVNMNRSKFKRPLSRNEVACFLSHRRVWALIAEAKDPVTMILEDDATFVQDPRPFLDALSERSECFEDVMIKLDGVSGRNLKVLTSVADQSLQLSDKLPPRTTGYVIGRRAAARLAAMEAPIARPIDIDLKFYWEHKVPILTLRKQMVDERQSAKSTIEVQRQKTKPGSSVDRFCRNLLYQIKYTYGRLSHPLKPDTIEGLGPVLRPQGRVRN